jgi:hypothetical protein
VDLGVDADFDDVSRDFPALVSDNLSGRRVLERVSTGIEAEPALLARVPASVRVDEGLVRLSARHQGLAQVLDQASSAIARVLVDEISGRPDLHVATWDSARHAIEALADLVEHLDAALTARPHASANR